MAHLMPLPCLAQSQRILASRCRISAKRSTLEDAIAGVVSCSRSSHGFSKVLSIPSNLQEQAETQKAKFSPQRFRDTSSAHIAAKLSKAGSGAVFGQGLMAGSVGAASFNNSSSPHDLHVPVYDQGHACSLSSVMQTNVPQPYSTKGNSSGPLNMPGGQWAQNDKYLSGDMTEHHQQMSTTSHAAAE